MAAKKEAIKDEIRNSIAAQNAQELINVRCLSPGFIPCLRWDLTLRCSCQKINEKCYEKCVLKPSTGLGSSEEVSTLMQRSHRLALMDCW